MPFKNPWIQLALGYVALVLVVLAASKLIYDPLDRALLLALNPDHPIPFLDTLMILITDTSMFSVSLLLLTWKLTSVRCRRYPNYRVRAKWTFRIIGFALLPLVAFMAWKQHYSDLAVPFIALSLLGLAFWFGGLTFTHWDDLTLHRYNRVFFIVLISILLASGFGEGFIKKTIARRRPLHEVNTEWNHAIHRYPDEITASGFSYASGHSIALFALLTPVALATRKRWLSVLLLSWAAVHSFTRVYTAAHYPYCAFMGSCFGLSVALLVYYTVGKQLLVRRILDGELPHNPDPVL